MKTALLTSLFLTMTLAQTVMANVTNEQNGRLVETCYLATHPDTGIKLEIFDNDEQGLVAVVTPTGNVRPHVIATSPVVRKKANGADVTGYESADKSFNFIKSSWGRSYKLTITGERPFQVAANSDSFMAKCE
jgi:hypothetical protein